LLHKTYSHVVRTYRKLSSSTLCKYRKNVYNWFRLTIMLYVIGRTRNFVEKHCSIITRMMSLQNIGSIRL